MENNAKTAKNKVRVENPDGRVMTIAKSHGHVFVHLNWYGYRPWRDERTSFMARLEDAIDDVHTHQILGTGNRDGCLSLYIIIETQGRTYDTSDVLVMLRYVFAGEEDF